MREATSDSSSGIPGLDVAVGIFDLLGHAGMNFGQGHFGYYGGQAGSWIPNPGYGPGVAVPVYREALPPEYALSPAATPDGQQEAPAVLPENAPPAVDESLSQKQVVLVNPATAQHKIAFLIDGQQGSLEPGQYLELSTGDSMVVEFDRSGGFGAAEYSLTEGVYEFKPTSRGWDLGRKVFSVMLDNSANEKAFRYLVDGEEGVVEAGQRQAHEGRFPITVAFDRGDGKEPAEVALPNGTYRIGISPATKLWDLFAAPEASDVAEAPPK